MNEITVNRGWLQVCLVRGLFWVRLFGRGLYIKDVRVHPLVFSERNGFVRMLRVGWLSIRLLGK